MIIDTEQTEAKQSFMKSKRQGEGAMQNSGGRESQRLEKELPSHRTMRLFTEVVCKQGFMLSRALLCLPRASYKPQQNRCVCLIIQVEMQS